MRRNELAKHGWSVMSGALLCFCAGAAAYAAPAASPVQIAIGNPMANAVVGGRISFSVAYDMGRTNIAAFAVFVDDSLQYSRPFITMTPHGIHYLELDTRQLPDGNHTVKISAMGPRGALAADVVNITVRNGIPGGPDLVPPLVQFRGLQDGDVVSGKINLDILAEDNLTQNLLLTIFANQAPVLIRNRPPYGIELDTTQFLDPNTGTGKIRLEAWAYDAAENLGKARPVTLTVVPVGAATNQTRKQGDPTLPSSRPMLPDVEMRSGLEPLLAPMQGSIVLPLGPRGQMPSPMMDPMPPAAAVSKLEGRPKITPGEVIPGSHPLPRMARNYVPAIDPDFAPVGSASHSGLAAGKVSVPYTAPRPSSRPSTASVRGIDPIPATISDSAPVLSTTRETRPAPRPAPAKPAGVLTRVPQASNAVKPTAPPKTASSAAGAVKMTLPSPQRVASAQIEPANPEIAPAPVRSVEPAKPASAPRSDIKIEVKGSAPSLMGAESPMPVPSVNPMPSPGGPRVEIPVTPPARAQKPLPAQPSKVLGNAPVIVAVVPKGAQPDKNGKIPAQVYRIQAPKAAPTPPMPRDVEVRVAKGDTLDSVAKRYKVSPRAVMLANAITHGSTLRRGSVLKVPGTFDVAMNGQSIHFDVSPRVENGLPLAPFRQIFEHAGGTVVWYPETQEVHAANDSKDIKLKIGSKEAVVNQMVVVMDKAAFVESGRTIVPISFMEKALDLQAEYDVKSGTIILARR